MAKNIWETKAILTGIAFTSNKNSTVCIKMVCDGTATRSCREAGGSSGISGTPLGLFARTLPGREARFSVLFLMLPNNTGKEVKIKMGNQKEGEIITTHPHTDTSCNT